MAPLLYRLWCRAWGHEADDWCSARAGFWDTAVRGSSALRAGIQRMLMNETNQWLQYRFAMVCWDLGKFYDSICLQRLITSIIALSFPPAIIVMTFIMYLAPRLWSGLGRGTDLSCECYSARLWKSPVTLPGGFCIVSSITFTGFIQLS